MVSNHSIRPARAAGTFYSGNPQELRKEIEDRLSKAGDFRTEGDICAAAVPHAGYLYSADIAAPVFRALRHVDFDTVVIIGHDFGAQAPGIIAIVPDCGFFRTPLGDVPVDTALCEALCAAEPRILCNDRVHALEHTIEVQLPFLQVTHPYVKIVPMLFGEVSEAHCRRLAQLLRQLQGDRRLLVLSSTDLSHYPPAELARQLDCQTVAYAEKMDLGGLCRWKNGGEWEEKPGVETPICSAGGLGTAIAWAHACGVTEVKVLKRGNSGDVSGDDRRVVGYSSLLFIGKPAEEQQEENGFSLQQDTQAFLLKLARQTITAKLKKMTEKIELPPNPELTVPAAVFVTLHKQGRLRGCIGTTAAAMPLYQAIAHFAEAAAFQDPRFQPVTSEELPEIDIEISVLSPAKRIHSPREILPRRHGVIIRQGQHCGLFLPQVWEQLPDKEHFLGYLCAEKAGLPYDAWKSPASQLYTFTVFAFQEKP